LLHAGHDHAVDRPPQRQPAPEREGDPGGPGGQPLSLHRLPQHRQGRSGRGRRCPVTVTEERTAEAPAREVGKSRFRKEDQRLITGRTRWTDNITLPGMLHLAMVRTPFAHANITSIDTSAAKASEGVVLVVTGEDVKDIQGTLANAWPITADQKAPTHLPVAI